MSGKVIPEGYTDGTIIDAWSEFAEKGGPTDLVACWEVRLDGYEGTDGDVQCRHKMYGGEEKEDKTKRVFEFLGLEYPDDINRSAEVTNGKRVRVGTFHNTTDRGKVFVNHYIVTGKQRERADPAAVAAAVAKKTGRGTGLPF